MSIRKIGVLNKRVINLLSLNGIPNSPILIGEDNIKHMLAKHPEDYKKYNRYISDIINSPDYIRLNPNDNSIEYVKEFQIENDFVKVAIRTSKGNNWFVRSMYTLNKKRVTNYIAKGTLILILKIDFVYGIISLHKIVASKNTEDGTGSRHPCRRCGKVTPPCSYSNTGTSQTMISAFLFLYIF